MDTTQTQTPRRTIIQSFAAAIAALATFGSVRAERGTTATLVEQEPQAKGPLFSSVIAHGGLVFVAGKGEHGPGDIKIHTNSVLNQLEAELKKAGSSMDKVLKCNVYLHDLKDYDGMNEVFRGRFGARPPVRTTVACYGGIPGQSLVEIDCIAAI